MEIMNFILTFRVIGFDQLSIVDQFVNRVLDKKDEFDSEEINKVIISQH